MTAEIEMTAGTKILIVILVISALFIIASASVLDNSSQTTTYLPTVTIAPKSIGYVTLRLNASTSLSDSIVSEGYDIIGFDTSNTRVDYYILTGTEFSSVSSYITTNQGLTTQVSSLVASGAPFVGLNCGGGGPGEPSVFTNCNGAVFGPPSSLPAGTYFFVYQNNDARASTKVVTFLVHYASAWQTVGVPLNAYGTLLSVGMIIAGFGAFVRLYWSVKWTSRIGDTKGSSLGEQARSRRISVVFLVIWFVYGALLIVTVDYEGAVNPGAIDLSGPLGYVLAAPIICIPIILVALQVARRLKAKQRPEQAQA